MSSQLHVLAIGLVVVGCVAERSGPSSPRERSDVASARATLPSASVAGSTAAPDSATLAPGTPGDVYLAVRGVGIVRLDDDRAVPIFPTKEKIVDMAVGPGGTLFASFYEIGTVRVRDGKAEKVSSAPYSRFAFRSDTDVWATPDEFDWAVHHYDGVKWSAVKTRADFKGKFDDNKLNDLAVTPDAVWVSSWNGLFRGAGRAWDKVELPADAGTDQAPWRLLVRGGHAVGRFANGYFEWDAGWKKLSWPSEASIEAVSASGLAIGSGKDQRRILLGMLGSEGLVKSDPTSSSSIKDAAVDDIGRAWIAGDFALAVIDPKGRVAIEFEPGTLAGVTGSVERVAVAAGGPARLPKKVAALKWELRGKVEIYRSSKPLANAHIEICASILGCADAVWKSSTTTAADGSFRLSDVPPGDVHIHVKVPSGLADCVTPFTSSPSHSVSIAHDCASAKAQSCNVPTIRVCLPFEMPPPR